MIKLVFRFTCEADNVRSVGLEIQFTMRKVILFIILLILHDLALQVQCGILSLLAVASLSGLLKPKPQSVPQQFTPYANYYQNPYADSMASSSSRHSHQVMHPLSSYSSSKKFGNLFSSRSPTDYLSTSCK